MSFIGDIYTTTAAKFAEPVASYASKLGTAAAPLFGAAFGAYILYQAYKLYTNKDISIEHIIHIIVVFGVIAFFIGANGQYTKVIAFVQGAGDGLAASLSNTPSATATSAIDTIYNLYEAPFKELDSRLDTFTDIGYLVEYLEQLPARFALWLSQTIFTVFIAINLLIAKIMVSLLLSVGILFIMFSAYQPTRNLFTSWVGLALNYIFLNVMYSLAAGISADIIKNTVVKGGSATALIEGSGTILVSTVIIVLAINQIPTLVSSLTGGVGISAFTITPSTMRQAASSLMRGASSIGKGAFKGADVASRGAVGRGATNVGNAVSSKAKDAYNTWMRRGSSGNK